MFVLGIVGPVAGLLDGPAVIHQASNEGWPDPGRRSVDGRKRVPTILKIG